MTWVLYGTRYISMYIWYLPGLIYHNEAILISASRMGMQDPYFPSSSQFHFLLSYFLLLIILSPRNIVCFSWRQYDVQTNCVGRPLGCGDGQCPETMLWPQAVYGGQW